MTTTVDTPTMRALIGGKGDDWALEQAPLPDQLGALRIQVHAAGMNRADLYALEGSYTANSQEEDGPFTAGMEIAGIVERGSLLAPDLPVGTRVMGITTGGFADYALGHPRLMVPIPENLSFEEAATLPVGLITEHDALVTQAGFTERETVLIVGGTSSIGMVGIQLAKALGAGKVIATTTSTAKRGALTDAGADVTIDTSSEDLVEAVLAATDGAGADVVLDHVGGEQFGSLPNATAIGGRIVSIGRLAGPATNLDLDTVAFRRQKLIGTTFSIRTRAELGEVVAALSDRVLPAVADGKITPRLDSVYPVDHASEAAQKLRENGAIGKIALSFADAHTGAAPAPAPVANFFGTIRQIGYVVRDLEASMQGFINAGIGPWFYLKGVRPGDFTYHGQPSDMVMDVAVANSGDIQIELITPVNDAPSMYKDFLDGGHEGVQHIAYWAEDYQGLYDRALAAGFTVGQEGRIGGEDGRFAYLATEHHPGTVIEISDLGGSKAFIFGLIKMAADNWDGSNPIQEIDANLIGGDPEAAAKLMAEFG
ncbi:putative oxidoreductase [Gordonia hirsuta DSM 44140 = NBRC 16056]|uniref:Putative oxidoreductase n=1 Tax=Gordonia hirsuta DSM 44140 = NBRC 16056 TaxID=1121927 RepID=L7L553_9ACTN|nr:zinc-binding dehydrogenase [Gordonia hirsuta]GAC56275.1 putative oxidoreductase [Gordonia hirsuta DSM 44140 = NBRC 16056]